MKTFNNALYKAFCLLQTTEKTQYIIYNTSTNTYRVNNDPKCKKIEELAKTITKETIQQWNLTNKYQKHSYKSI